MDHVLLPEATDKGGFTVTIMAISTAIFWVSHHLIQKE